MNPLEATSVSDFLAVGIAGANFQVGIYSVDGDLLGEYVHNTGVYTPGVTLGTSKQIYLQVSGVDSIAAGAGYFEIELNGSGIYLELYVNYEPISGDKVYFDENCVAYSDEALTTIILGEYHTETSIDLTEAASTDLENLTSESATTSTETYEIEGEREWVELSLLATDVVDVEGEVGSTSDSMLFIETLEQDSLVTEVNESTNFTESLTQDNLIIEASESVEFTEADSVENADSVNQTLDTFNEDYLLEVYSSLIQSIDLDELYYMYSSGTLDLITFKEHFFAENDNLKGIIDKTFFIENIFYQIIPDLIESIQLSEAYTTERIFTSVDSLFLKEQVRGFVQAGKYEASIGLDKVVIYDSVLAKILPIEGV